MKVIDSHDRYSRYLKPTLQKLVYRKPTKCRLLIFGCQRSGTTLLTKLFDNQFCASVYAEESILSNRDRYQLRLNEPEDVVRKLDDDRAPLVIMKPLVESQHALSWLSLIPRSRALWQFRHPVDVAYSSLKKFGPNEGAINKIRPLVDGEFAKKPWTGWLTENVSEATVNLMAKYYAPDMLPFDAGLLFWYMRNVLFFEQDLGARQEVRLFGYEDLMANPGKVLSGLSEFVGTRQLKLDARILEPRAVAQPPAETNPEILAVCSELYQRLRTAAA